MARHQEQFTKKFILAMNAGVRTGKLNFDPCYFESRLYCLMKSDRDCDDITSKLVAEIKNAIAFKCKHLDQSTYPILYLLLNASVEGKGKLSADYIVMQLTGESRDSWLKLAWQAFHEDHAEWSKEYVNGRGAAAPNTGGLD